MAGQRAKLLTPREHDVLRLHCRGMGDRETAAQLGLRPSTVRQCRRSAVARLQAVEPRLSLTPALTAYILALLDGGMAPDAIVAHLQREPEAALFAASHAPASDRATS